MYLTWYIVNIIVNSDHYNILICSWKQNYTIKYSNKQSTHINIVLALISWLTYLTSQKQCEGKQLKNTIYHSPPLPSYNKLYLENLVAIIIILIVFEFLSISYGLFFLFARMDNFLLYKFSLWTLRLREKTVIAYAACLKFNLASLYSCWY